MNVILSDNESVWPNLWPQTKYRSAWPLFHGPVNSPYIAGTFDGWPSFFWIMSRCDATYTLSKYRSQWLILYGLLVFLVFWRLSGGWTSYFRIIRQCDPIFDTKNVGQHDLYVMVQWFCPMSWMNTIRWDSGSVTQALILLKYSSHWPIFHAPLALLYIFIDKQSRDF